MIVVKIELWPYGMEDRAREIARMIIANDGGTAELGDYAVQVEAPPPGTPKALRWPSRTVHVRQFKRLTTPIWVLVQRALTEARLTP